MMLWSLDVRTVFLVLVLMGIMQAVLMLYVHYLHANLPFVLDWSQGYILFAIGLVVMLMGGAGPSIYILILSSVMRSSGHMFICIGIAKLCGRTPKRSMINVAFLFLLSMHAIGLWIGESLLYVAMVFTFLASIFSAYAIYSCITAPRDEFRKSVLLVAGLMCIYVVCLLLRAGIIYVEKVQEAIVLSKELGWVLLCTAVVMGSHFTMLILVTSHRLQIELQRQVVRDPLTNVFNRRGLLSHIDRDWARACRHGSPISMLMIDADYFKKINDVFGHAAGDAVLVAIAQQIQGVLRQEDVLARYGGEEFVVMLPDTCLRDALDVAERIRLEVANLVHPSLDAQHTVTVSIGVSERLVTQKHSEQLLECADRALFLAKQTGRNRICGSQAGVVSVSGTEPALSQLARS